MEPYVITALITLLSRIIKLSWYDHDQFRGVIDDARNLMQMNTTEHVYLGLKLLNVLTQEVN